MRVRRQMFLQQLKSFVTSWLLVALSCCCKQRNQMGGNFALGDTMQDLSNQHSQKACSAFPLQSGQLDANRNHHLLDDVYGQMCVAQQCKFDQVRTSLWLCPLQQNAAPLQRQGCKCWGADFHEHAPHLAIYNFMAAHTFDVATSNIIEHCIICFAANHMFRQSPEASTVLVRAQANERLALERRSNLIHPALCEQRYPPLQFDCVCKRRVFWILHMQGNQKRHCTCTSHLSSASCFHLGQIILRNSPTSIFFSTDERLNVDSCSRCEPDIPTASEIRNKESSPCKVVSDS